MKSEPSANSSGAPSVSSSGAPSVLPSKAPSDSLCADRLKTLIGCCLLYAAVSGIGANCKGVFYRPASEGLGVSLSLLTGAITIGGIVSAVCLFPCCSFFKKVSSRLSLTLFSLIYGVAGMLLGTSQSVVWYYVWLIVQSLSSGFLLFYVLQHLIGNWYPEKKGTMLGFVLMSSGIAGMIFNPIISLCIDTFGWRGAYLIQFGLVLLLTVPASLFLIRKSPELVDERFDKDSLFAKGSLFAKDKSRAQKSEVSAEKPRSILLVLLFLILILLDLCMAIPQHLPSLSTSIGKTATFGATLVSVSMGGNIVGKMGLGLLNDKAGVYPTTIIGAILVGTGCVLLTLSESAALLIGAFLGGMILSIVTLQFPLLYRQTCSPAYYEKIYPTVCSVNIVVGSFSSTALSFGYNTFSDYAPVMWILIGFMVLVIALTLILKARPLTNCPS